MNTKNVLSTLVVSLLFLAGHGLFASKPAHWTVSSQAEFLKGDFDGVSVTSDGKLVLAPELTLALETGEALIHSAVSDSIGNIYFGTGSNGKIFRLPPRGQGGEWTDLEENSVFGLAVDSQNRLFAATGPEGKIYKVDAQGNAVEFFDPKEKYIWDLAIDRSGNLFVGTGPKGIIYKVDSQGEGTEFYDSKETHIVSLGWDLDGNLLAGTAPSGILYRISNSGSVFALYDSAMNELKATSTDRYGNIFAVGLSGGSTEAAATATVSSTSTGKTTSTTEESAVTVEGGTSGQKLEVYKISKDGLVEIVYSADKALAYDLQVQSDGTLLIATGEKGRILAVNTQKFLKLLSQAPDEQVTQLIAAGQTTYAAASNLGKVYQLSTKVARKGVYESDVLDAKVVSTWGKARWQVVNPSGTAPALFTRSGNTNHPDGTWSDWAGPYSDAEGSDIQSPASRYLQWKVEFTSDGEEIPLTSEANALESVSLSYLQRNVAPVISKLIVHAPGSAFVENPVASAPGGAPLGGPGSSYATSLPSSVRALASGTVIPPRKVYIPGARSFAWTASDANGDDLLFTIYYRSKGENSWKVLESDYPKAYYTLDGTSVPDGIYTFRVVASDHPSNPSDLALTGEIKSKEFVVSNSIPAIEVGSPQVEGEKAKVRVTVKTGTSRVYQLEYSVDSKKWQIAYPTDGIADSRQEDYDLELSGLTRGEHVVSIRVVDSVGTVGTGKATFQVR
jgi:hypothetical protein